LYRWQPQYGAVASVASRGSTRLETAYHIDQGPFTPGIVICSSLKGAKRASKTHTISAEKRQTDYRIDIFLEEL